MLGYRDTFSTLALADLESLVRSKKERKARFVNVHAKRSEDGFILIYSFIEDEAVVDNYEISIAPDDVVPSITPQYPSAFFFENETHDLFGIDIRGISLDYHGNFYETSIEHPMAQIADASDSTSVGRKHGLTERIDPRSEG